jgi:sigma-E factor negative regulatory protein RseC
MAQLLEHKGVVTAVSDGLVEVEFAVQSACSECKAHALCGVASGEKRFVTISDPMASYYAVGEEVMISVSEGMGMKAATWAYIVPFFVLLGSLLLTLHFGLSETVAGLISLGLVAVYYVCLWFFRKRIERDIVFKIRKI